MFNQSTTLIGFVERISGTKIRGVLSVPTNVGVIVIEGQGHKIGQVGSFVRLPLGIGALFGVVTGIGAVGENSSNGDALTLSKAWIDIELVGESDVEQRFRRGISRYPTVNDEIHIISRSDLEKIYGTSNSEQFVTLGNVAGTDSLACPIDANRLIMRHSLVVGSTGSGKSTTVSSIVRKLADGVRFPQARVLIIDMHGEYAAAFGNLARVFSTNSQTKDAERLLIPYWALNFDEFSRIAFAVKDELVMSSLREHVVASKAKTRVGSELKTISPEALSDAPIPFDVHQMWLDLFVAFRATHTVAATGQSSNTIAYLNDTNGNPMTGNASTLTAPTFQPQQPQKIFLAQPPFNGRRALDMLSSRLADKRLSFLFEPGDFACLGNQEPRRDLHELLSDWLGSHKSITVLDLSGTPTDVASEIVGAVVRIVFDALFWSRESAIGGRSRPLLLVLEEAHSYLKDTKSSAAISIDRVVREGRKYGIGCMIVSQRPTDIDAGILSQCGTCFSMRMSNPADRAYVANGVSESFGPLMELLPGLRTGEAVITGEAVSMPVRVEIPLPPRTERPRSEDPVIYSADASRGWNSSAVSNEYGAMVTRWRTQTSSLEDLKEVTKKDDP